MFVVGGNDLFPSFRGFIGDMKIYRRVALGYDQVWIKKNSFTPSLKVRYVSAAAKGRSRFDCELASSFSSNWPMWFCEENIFCVRRSIKTVQTNSNSKKFVEIRFWLGDWKRAVLPLRQNCCSHERILKFQKVVCEKFTVNKKHQENVFCS